MEKAIMQLVEISKKFGKDKNYTIAGGGNTSFKNEKELWVKASGFGLADITEEGFVKMDREKLAIISEKAYSIDSFVREREVKEDLEKACIEKGKRPSVETSLHNAIDFAFIVHMHPFLVNAVLCSNKAEETVRKLWSNMVLFVPYIDPGYVLFKKVEEEINRFKIRNGSAPKVIFMQNHGIFVGADSVGEIEVLYKNIMNDIINVVPKESRSFSFSDYLFDKENEVQLPSDFLNSEGLMYKGRNNELISSFSKEFSQFEKIQIPFTPDVIVYCKSKYLFVSVSAWKDVVKMEDVINNFKVQNGYLPKVLILENKGLMALGDSPRQLENVLDVFEDQMKIGWFSEFFGGPHHMEPHQIEFIDTWEVENYRRKIGG